MARIVLADSCPILRRGLKRVLRRIPNCRVVGEVASADELIKLLPRSKFDALILDLDLRTPDGRLVLLEEIVRGSPGKSVLVYTSNDNPSTVIRTLRMGAAGYLTKDAPEDEVIEAVETISRGQRYIATRVKDAVAWLQIEIKKPKQAVDSLSARERQVFHGLAAGRGPKEIAGELALHPKTVSSYRHRLLKKLHINTNADLVRLASNIPS